MSEHKPTVDRTSKNIAIIVQAAKLTKDEPGLTRAVYAAQVLAEAGYNVDLITSSFQHWEKKHRATWKKDYREGHSFNVVFIDEPGYSKNIDLRRMKSHKVLGHNLQTHLEANGGKYDAIWCQIPPNNIARIAGEFAKKHGIPFVIDVNDLWPEAMRMAVDIPVLSDIAFSGFVRDARRAYECATAIVATSSEYANYPSKYIADDYPRRVIYVGNDLDKFDAGIQKYSSEIDKPTDEVWFTYAGTLGKSYDISTLIDACVDAVNREHEVPYSGKRIRVKILGDGPDRTKLEEQAILANAPVDFLGYMDYEHMAAFLSKSDVLVNSLIPGAPQSIVSKISDYMAAGKLILNTGESLELISLLDNERCGVSVPAGDVTALADKIIMCARQQDLRKIRGANSRKLAEDVFDRKIGYKQVVELIDEILQ